jgi:hypothetical protein
MSTSYEGKGELVMRRVEPGVAVPGVPDRATRVASWVGWHFFELAGVTVPAAVGVAVTPWAWLVSGVVGAGWGVHEFRTMREQAAIKAGRDLPAVTTPPTTDNGTDDSTGADTDNDTADSAETPDAVSGVDGTRVGGVR